jgi:heat shock protein HslJ
MAKRGTRTAILLAIGLGSTGSFNARAASMNQFNLVGDSWKLITMTTADKSVTGTSGLINDTIRLTADGHVKLTAACNTGGGAYTLVGNKLTISPLLITLRACPDGPDGSQFAKMLSGEQTISWNAAGMVLTGSDGGVFELAPALTGVVWQWIPSAGGNATPAIWTGVYTVAFDQNGSVAVGADCNRGKSTYLTNGGALAIRGIAVTRVQYPEGTLAGQFVAGLQSATAYSVGGGKLTITTSSGDWTFTAQPANGSATATPAS